MQVKDNKPMTIIDIFKQIATTCHHAKDIFTGKEKFGIDPVHFKPNNATQMQTRYEHLIKASKSTHPTSFVRGAAMMWIDGTFTW
jgi:hypothetical protein